MSKLGDGSITGHRQEVYFVFASTEIEFTKKHLSVVICYDLFISVRHDECDALNGEPPEIRLRQS